LNELLHAASRTFALGIDLLPEPLRTEVETAYLILRVSDYLEDNVSMASTRKAVLLERWARVLEGDESIEELAAELAAAEEDSPDALVARNAARVFGALRSLRPAARDILVRHTTDASRGMARWALRGPDIPDEAALDDYMHEVAGRVGWLLTELFADALPAVGRRRGEMMTLGREFGLALQTVNVIRGLHSDWERGWIFIPATFLPDEAPDPRALLEGRVEDGAAARAIVERLVHKASKHLDAAGRYLTLLPRRAHGVRLFCLLPYLFAVRTLAISGGDTRVFREELKITRREVRAIARRARVLGWSNRWIAWYRRRLARP
jgi:farnesyl-diphosphate farnesyltransferase